MSAHVLYTPATPSFVPVGENDRQLLLISFCLKYFIFFVLCIVTLLKLKPTVLH